MHADALRNRGQRQRLREMTLNQRARLLQPRRRRPFGIAGDPARCFGEHAERDAFDGQPRDFVAQPEFAVKTVRQVHDEPAAKRRGAREHRRVLPRPRIPRIVDVDDQAGRPRFRHEVGMRLVGAPEEQAGRFVAVRLVAADLREPAGQHQHEPGVGVQVAMNALARLVLHFREHKSAYPAPAQNLAVREVARRLSESHFYCELCRPSAGGRSW